MKYQEELFNDIIHELGPLLVKHWQELANNKDIRPLDVDYAMYTTLNEQGIIRIFTARSDEGKLVGYFSFAIANNLHYKTWKFASIDVYYVDPEYRKGGIGFEMVGKVEDWLRSLGVKSLTLMDKLQHSHEKFFIALGYKPIEQHYEKVL